MSNPLICGVCMIKDAVDLAPFLCGHYLASGFDRLVFMDDGSSDGTYELLRSIGRANGRVVVKQTGESAFRQKDVMNAAVNAMIADGYTIIFPFDSDEFWNIDAAQARIAATKPGIFIGHWIHFVQDRRETGFSRRGLLKATYRAPVLAGVSAETVERYEQSFVCHSMPKVGFRADGPVNLIYGQHQLLDGPSSILADDLEVFHLPLRTAAVIDRRAAHATRVLVDARPGENWQARFFFEEVKAGRRAVAWAANSASADGFLDLPDRRIMLIEDCRLNWLLRRAWRYMVVHHPVQMLRLLRGRNP